MGQGETSANGANAIEQEGINLRGQYAADVATLQRVVNGQAETQEQVAEELSAQRAIIMQKLTRFQPTCNRYRLLFGFEYRLILSMFYDWVLILMMFYVWFRVSFDTQYVLFIVSRYRMILDMFYVTFQGYSFWESLWLLFTRLRLA